MIGVYPVSYGGGTVSSLVLSGLGWEICVKKIRQNTRNVAAKILAGPRCFGYLVFCSVAPFPPWVGGKTPDLKPLSDQCAGYRPDIIFFWVARIFMKRSSRNRFLSIKL